MYNLRITTLAEANALLEEGWPTRAISLVSPGCPLPNFGPHHRIIHMDDIPFEREGMIAPQVEHVFDALQFTQDIQPHDRLLVHCYAGVSRSTSIAIGVLIAQGVHWQTAFDHVGSLRPFMMPNTRVMKFLDEHFALDGAMMSYLGEWLRKQHDSALSMRAKMMVTGTAPSKSDVDWMKAMRGILG